MIMSFVKQFVGWVGCAATLSVLPLCAWAQDNTLTPAEHAAGWRLLFDGKTTDGWRGYRMDSVPAGWQVVDGALTRVAGGDDILAREPFANFMLELDWNIAPGGNSGILYRVTEEYDAPYWSGPEMQVLDDAGHPDGKSPLTSAGASYALYPAPRGIVKPAGEWNHVRIVVNGNHVEHWLNGTRVVEYELGSPDWVARVAKSKFAKWRDFGRATAGYIDLQDHGDRVAFKNIKIRVLP
jgi:3-keto-disaccharide hydrolase